MYTFTILSEKESLKRDSDAILKYPHVNAYVQQFSDYLLE